VVKSYDNTDRDRGAGDGVGVETLMDWLLGRLDDEQASRIDALVAAGDDHVARTLDWLRWLAYQAPLVGTERPPPHLSDALVSLFDDRPGRPAANRAVPVDHILELLFDSRHDLALAGTRGGDANESGYRLAFTCDVADVVLQIRSSGPGLETVRGQVLLHTDSVDERATTLIDVFTAAAGADPESPSSSTDALGRFVLRDVPTGASPLRITGKSLGLVVHMPRQTPEP
jgi:hypothetical protein